MKSTSISRSRHASRYATLLVRTITRALESLRPSIAQTRFASSRGLHAISRSACWIGLAHHALGRAVALDGADVAFDPPAA